MKVTLLHNTPLYINAVGARTCWDSHSKSDTGLFTDICGENDKALIDRVGNKFKHASVLEHVSYNFYIDGISRACLQELARHRMTSLSVKSTRYTLKELKEEKSFLTLKGLTKLEVEYERASKYIVLTGDNFVDTCSIKALDGLRDALLGNSHEERKPSSNDIAKYCLIEAYKTELTWTINMRSLQNFLSLRSDKSALWEIRNLANAIYEELPEDHKYMYESHFKFCGIDIVIDKTKYTELTEELETFYRHKFLLDGAFDTTKTKLEYFNSDLYKKHKAEEFTKNM